MTDFRYTPADIRRLEAVFLSLFTWCVSIGNSLINKGGMITCDVSTSTRVWINNTAYILDQFYLHTYKKSPQFPVNMLDPIQKHFGWGQSWPFWPVCSQNQPGLYMPGLISCILLSSSVFPKKARAILCKTNPDPIWTAWSGFGQTHLV